MSDSAAAAIAALVGTSPISPTEMALGGAYEGAARHDRETAAWHPPIQSADMDILPDKDIADARVQDLTRNDGYVQAGGELHKDNVVGHSYVFNSEPNTRALGITDQTWVTEFKEELEAKFALAAESPDCWLDATRTSTLTGMVRLAVGTYAATGEVFSVVEWMRNRGGRPFQTAIHQIDTARLRTPYNIVNNERVRGGVRKDMYGAPQGYYVSKAHPRDYQRFFAHNTIQDHHYIKARRSGSLGRLNAIHVFEPGRPDQSRGISAIVAGLRELKIAKDFKRITLQNAAVNAMFAAAIESERPPAEIVAALGGSMQSNPLEAFNQADAAYMKSISQFASGAKHMQMDGVRIPHLYPGTKLNMLPAGTPGGVGQDFEKSLIRHLSAILGVSYEQLSHDYSETNYSSARAAMTETWKFMMSRKRMVADRYANAIMRLWFEEIVNAGELETMGYSKAPNMYDGMNFDAYTTGNWIGASRGQIDPLKETQAAVLRLKYNLSTLKDEHASNGNDWRKQIVQAEIEKNELESRGLVVEESNAINAASPEPGEAKGGNDDGEEKTDGEPSDK